MKWLSLLLLFGCEHKPDAAEIRLRDTTIGTLHTLLERAQHPSNKFERDDSEATAKAACDKPGLDRVMKDKKLEQDILTECAKVLPQIEVLIKQ